MRKNIVAFTSMKKVGLKNTYGTRPLSQCYQDKITHESILNQFKSENSFLGRRTYPDK